MVRWIAFILACAAAVIGATLLWSTAAMSQVQCFPVAVAERTLMDAFGEQRIAVRYSGGKSIRFYANPTKRTWTTLAVDGRGAACPVASGTDLDFAKPPPAGKAS